MNDINNTINIDNLTNFDPNIYDSNSVNSINSMRTNVIPMNDNISANTTNGSYGINIEYDNVIPIKNTTYKKTIESLLIKNKFSSSIIKNINYDALEHYFIIKKYLNKHLKNIGVKELSNIFNIMDKNKTKKMHIKEQYKKEQYKEDFILSKFKLMFNFNTLKIILTVMLISIIINFIMNCKKLN